MNGLKGSGSELNGGRQNQLNFLIIADQTNKNIEQYLYLFIWHDTVKSNVQQVDEVLFVHFSHQRFGYVGVLPTIFWLLLLVLQIEELLLQ